MLHEESQEKFTKSVREARLKSQELTISGARLPGCQGQSDTETRDRFAVVRLDS